MLSRFILGTTRLGNESIPFETRVALARKAADEGIWFHTSHTYGSALQVLKTAFDLNRSRIPRMIYKIGWYSVEEARGQLEEQLAAVGLKHMDCAQLCAHGSLAADLQTGGPGLEQLHRMKADGLVGSYVLQVFPWSSGAALDCLRGGHNKGLIDAYIFYLNPIQRCASNELWDLLREMNEPIIALRSVAGCNVDALRTNPKAPDFMRARADLVAPLFHKSGVASWTEFAIRFSLGLPRVISTVGATSRIEGLQDFMAASAIHEPIDQGIVKEIFELHRVWSDAEDMKAEPWTL